MNDTQPPHPSHPTPQQQQPASGWDFLSLLRVIFYIIITLKLIELSFLRRKKATLKERIHRKFLFTHQQMMHHFTDEDKSEMEVTLANTLRNTNSPPLTRQSRKNTTKKVQFCIDKNSYHQPRVIIDSDGQEEYLDVEQDKAELSVQQKKEGGEAIIKSDLLGLEEITTEETINDSSRLTQSTQSGSDVNDSDIKQIVQAEDKVLTPIPENSNENLQ